MNRAPGIEENRRIAALLRDYAGLLEAQGADGFRIRAYRAAADTADRLDEPLSAIRDREGRDGLVALPAIGRGIAGAITQILDTGRWAQLERLQGELSPETLLRTLPGIGPALAEQLAEEDGIESLEELEAALHDPDVKFAGIGPRRRSALIPVLAERLGRAPGRGRARHGGPLPPVTLLLTVDGMYRERAAAGQLRRIAPRRFNPSGEAWLPVMHAGHDDWHFTALFSNTAQAHRLGKTDDWVVIYHQKEGEPEGRSTVVTETRGPMKGQRVVRGREADCAAHYRA